MKEKVYVDRLFADYEDTPEIKDFKEEIAANLAERVRGLVAKGSSEEKAFKKAAAELGDITAIADEIGKEKRNEAIGQLYMKAKVPITKRTAAGVTAASGLLLLAIGLAAVTFFSKTSHAILYHVAAFLLSAACGSYTYFGLTQETAAHYATKNRRALAYGAVCMACFLGAGFACVTFFIDSFELSAALVIKTAFVLPAICALVFLLATEPKRQKPWLKAMADREIENSMRIQQDMVSPVKAARFGAASGGLWVLAIAVFATLFFVFEWQYAWLVFLFALAAQVFMLMTIFEKK